MISLAMSEQTQIRIGMAAGILAVFLYAAKGSAPPPETAEVVSISRDLPARSPLRERDLSAERVPAELSSDFITWEERGKLLEQTLREAQLAGTLLAPSLLEGGREERVLPPIPEGHRAQPLELDSDGYPAGLAPGVRVDLVAGGSPLGRDLLVLDDDPLTVAVPIGQVLALSGRGEHSLLLRPLDAPGELPEPYRPPPPPPLPAVRQALNAR